MQKKTKIIFQTQKEITKTNRRGNANDTFSSLCHVVENVNLIKITG